jgi:hypothetical protein
MTLEVFAVDFETYYDADYCVATLGPDAYCADPRFDPYLVAVHGPGISFCGAPSEFNWNLIKDAIWVSHNARFDSAVYNAAVAKGLIFGGKGPSVWYCTADLSVYLAAPRSLAGAMSVLFGVAVDKAPRDKMKGKHYADLTDAQKQELVQYAASDAENCYRLWVENEAKWPQDERRISLINRRCGERGVAIDRPKLASYIETLKQVLWEAGRKIPWEWDKTPLAHNSLRAECRKAGIPAPASLAADDIACVAWEDEYGSRFPWVAAMRDWRRANMLLKKLETVAMRLTPDGVLPFGLKYFGGHTGRFSGDGGFNIQNLPRGEIMGIDMRSLIIPRPGHKLLVIDLAQIEARVTLWLARDRHALDLVRQGISVYEVHAIETMGWDPAKGKLKEKDPDMYRLAKARVLGLGFGCGSVRFQDVARTMGGLDLTLEQAKECVDAFRSSNQRIVRLWKELQVAAMRSANGNFTVELPSGRSLTYHNVLAYPELSAEVVRGKRRTKIYGGKLTENLVQATARDVFTDGLLRLNDDGYRILFHVHDEYVIEVPIPEAGALRDRAVGIVETTPTWLPGCPIGAEAALLDCYTK